MSTKTTKTPTQRLARHPKPEVAEPEVITRKKAVPEGAPKWTAETVRGLIPKLGLDLIPMSVAPDAYDTRRWAIDSLTCHEAEMLGEMLAHYAELLGQGRG